MDVLKLKLLKPGQAFVLADPRRFNSIRDCSGEINTADQSDVLRKVATEEPDGRDVPTRGARGITPALSDP